jgi:hypothetical protein
MGLAERRALKEYQEKKFPAVKAALDKAAGFEVPLEVEWDKIAGEGEASSYDQDYYFTDTYFTPLTDALKQIAGEDMGRAALKKGLKKVLVTFDAATAPATNYKNGWPFKNGVLTINYQAGVNTQDPSAHAERVEALVENLEAGL